MSWTHNRFPRPLIALLVAGLLIVSCGSSQPAPANTPPPSAAAQPTTATQPTAVPQQPPAASSAGDFAPIVNAFRAQLDADRFRITMVLVTDEETSTEIIEFVAPNRFRLQMEGDDLVVIGEIAYELRDGVYEVLPDGGMIGRMVANLVNPSQVEQLTPSIVSVTPQGTETLDGRTMQVYEYIARIGDEVESSTVWISQADGRPYQVRQVHETELTMITYEYDVDIVIEDPAAAN